MYVWYYVLLNNEHTPMNIITIIYAEKWKRVKLNGKKDRISFYSGQCKIKLFVFTNPMTKRVEVNEFDQYFRTECIFDQTKVAYHIFRLAHSVQLRKL